MQRVWQFLLNPRVLTVLGLLALGAFLFLGAEVLKVSLRWVAFVLLLMACVAGAKWLIKRQQERKAAAQLEAAMDADLYR